MSMAGGRRPYGIGAYLVALILIAAVPLFVIAAFLVVRQSEIQRTAFEQSLLQTSRALSVAVDRQLALYQVMLETLAEDDALRRDDLVAFHDQARRVAERHHAVFVSFFDASGRQIFNTLRPPGVKLPTPFRDAPPPGEDAEHPPIGDALSIKRVLQSGQAYCSDLFYGLVARRLIFTVNVPVVRDGRVHYVLNAAFEPGVMNELLTRNGRFRGVPAVIFDRRGFILGRWQDAARFTGHRVSAVREGTMPRESGVGNGTTLDGLPVVFSYVRSPVTGWGVNVGAERSHVDPGRGLAFGGLLAAAGLALGLAGALLLATRLRRSIASLAGAAARNEAPRVDGLRTREIVELEGALTEAAAARNAQALERESRLVAEARKSEAEQASRAKDHFIAVLSHELRNPLSPIRNSVTLLRAAHERGEPAPPAVVDVLDRQSEQLSRLVADLLDVSRISSGKIGLQRKNVDLREVARHAVEAALPRAAARGLRLSDELAAGPVCVLGDFTRLSQIASNLLDNAVKFTPSGGEIRLVVDGEEREAILSVSDSGKGIDAEQLPYVFGGQPRAFDRQRREGGGLGLGLSLARTLAELHGGALDASSEGAGRGSTFVLRLPRVAPRPAPEGPPEPSAAAARGAGRRVLIVDDNADAAVTTRAILDAKGFATQVAHDAEAALAVAAQFRPDVALLDIGLPGMNGYELALRLRPLLGERVRLVALTGWGQEADRRKSRDAGFDDHLVKPADMETLLKAVGSGAAPGDAGERNLRP